MPKTRALVGDPLPVNLQGKALKFVHEMVAGRSWEDAGTEAGLTIKSARQYRYRYREIIQQLVGEKMTELTACAVTVLGDLMRSSDSDTVKLNAAKEVLDRVGPPAVRKMILDFGTSPDDAIRAFLLETLGSEEAVSAIMAAVRPGALTARPPALEHAP